MRITEIFLLLIVTFNLSLYSQDFENFAKVTGTTSEVMAGIVGAYTLLSCKRIKEAYPKGDTDKN